MFKVKKHLPSVSLRYCMSLPQAGMMTGLMLLFTVILRLAQVQINSVGLNVLYLLAIFLDYLLIVWVVSATFVGLFKFADARHLYWNNLILNYRLRKYMCRMPDPITSNNEQVKSNQRLINRFNKSVKHSYLEWHINECIVYVYVPDQFELQKLVEEEKLSLRGQVATWFEQYTFSGYEKCGKYYVLQGTRKRNKN